MVLISVKLDKHIGIRARSKLCAGDHMDMVGRHSSWKVKVKIINRYKIQHSLSFWQKEQK